MSENNNVINFNKEVKDPMSFMTDEQTEAQKHKMEEFNKALHFGIPSFAEKLMDVYEQDGIEGLKHVERMLDTYVVVRELIVREITGDQESTENKQPSSNTNKDQWEDPAEAEFDTDKDETSENE